MKILKLLFLLILSLHTNIQNIYADANTVEESITSEDEKNPIQIFKQNFSKALKNPEKMEWVIESYRVNIRDGQDHASGFLAYTDLLQGLYRAINNIDKQDMSIPNEVAIDFENSLSEFRKEFNDLTYSSSDERESEVIYEYDKRLIKLYYNFLVKFIYRYEQFFLSRFNNSIKKAKNGSLLDIIDSAYFGLNENWSSFEAARYKYTKNEEEAIRRHDFQFNKIYTYFTNNGQILLIAHHHRPCCYNGGLLMDIYKYDLQKNNVRNLSPFGWDIEISSKPGVNSNFVEMIDFNGRYLKLYLYDNEEGTCLINYKLDTEKNIWIIEKYMDH